MPNMIEMLRQAQALQAKIKDFQAELEKQEFTGAAGGGAVTVVLNGKHEMKRITISPEALKAGDAAKVQDLVRDAVNEAGRQVNDKLKSEMGRISGGLLPPGMF